MIQKQSANGVGRWNREPGIVKKIGICVIILELLILLFAGLYCSSRENVALSFTQDELIDDSGEKNFYVDKSYDTQYVATPEFTLPRGIYTLEAEYEYAGQVKIEVYHSDGWFGNNVGGEIYSTSSKGAVCDFRIKYKNRPLQVRGRLTGDSADGDYILLRNIRITTASVNMLNFLFRIAVFFVVIDSLAVLYLQRDKMFPSQESRNCLKILLLLIGVCCLPLTVGYLFGNAHDLRFHLTRIEGIKDGLLSGMFPVKIQPNWLDGHGYAVSVFYGDILLYIPALFRMFGVSVLASYNLYVLLVNVLTVWIAYHCFYRMCNDRRSSLVCTVIYSFNIFRLYDIYTRAAVGEYTAMIFFPLVLYGLWKVYTLPEESKEHAASWMTITAGCVGIFLSHMLSTEMAALFILLTALILWKKTFRKRTFVVLLKAASITVLLSLWFLVPFLDYMASDTYAVNDLNRYVPYRLEDKGGFLVQFFMTQYDVMGTSGGIGSRGVSSNMPYTLGCAAMLIPVGWFLLCMGKKERSNSEKREEYLALFLSLFGLVLTLCAFPYTWLAEKIPALMYPIHSIQFSWRFFAIVSVLFSWMLCIILKKSWMDQKKKVIFSGLLFLLSMWQGIDFISEFMNEASPYYIYQEGGISSFDVVFGEYFPVSEQEEFHIGSYTQNCIDQISYDADCVQVEEWHRDKGAVVVSLKNLTGQTQQVEVPILLYKGYQAVTDQGERLSLSPGTAYRASAAVPGNFLGTFRVKFCEPWYWRLSEAISLLTLAGVVLWRSGFLKRRRMGN